MKAAHRKTGRDHRFAWFSAPFPRLGFGAVAFLSLLIGASCKRQEPSPLRPSEPASAAERPASASSGTSPTATEPRDEPAVRDARGAPTSLLIVLHGYGSTGSGHLGFFPVSDPSMAVVAPNGLVDGTGSRYWNANTACCDFEHRKNDDVAYLSRLIDSLEAKWHLPPGKVHLAGHSNGAAMALRLACELPTRFASVVALAGPVDAIPAVCPSTADLVIIHGDNDRVVPYAGGALRSGIHPNANSMNRNALGAPALAAAFAARGGCSSEPHDDADPLDIDGARPDAETRRTRYSCGVARTVELWTMGRVGHAPYAPTPAWGAALASVWRRKP